MTGTAFSSGARAMGKWVLMPIIAAGMVMGLPGQAAAGPVEVQYAISLAGFSIGRASLSAELTGGSYNLNVSTTLTGLAGAITGGRGAATAKGSVGGNVLTNGFSMNATNGKESRSIQIAASAGSVRGVTIEPPFQNQGNEDRIPLRESHKNGIVDPVSALIMPSRTADPLDKANCERRLPVFDGSQRFDVILSYSGTKQVRNEKGYSGPVLVCSARYVPVAGHRPDRRVTKFMAENREMSAWLVPVNGGKQLMPYRISVKTLIGTTVIEAESFNPG